MGKRSHFPRRDRDCYDTPAAAVAPLVPHLPKSATWYAEPCAGAGRLIDALAELWPQGRVAFASDIEPRRADIGQEDALEINAFPVHYFITNPPWPAPGGRGEPTVSIARHLSEGAPTWLLLPADFAHCRYFSDLAPRCAKIVSVGRVSWAENGVSGKDNAAWYLFDAHNCWRTRFYPRAAV